MPTFKYKPFYQYNGPTLKNPLREELSLGEAEKRIRCFFEEIEHYFEEDITIKKEDDIALITGEIKQEDCDKAVRKCLNNLDLFANKVP